MEQTHTFVHNDGDDEDDDHDDDDGDDLDHDDHDDLMYSRQWPEG